jgi:(p)ppGpp synthase/HD superfamily hydrolase
MNDVLRLTRAYDFAALKHIGQRRKGDAQEPYVNHLTEVAHLVARATGGAIPDLVVAAILHDSVEDTDTRLDEIAEAFGARVAGWVAEVTDDKTLPKAERKSAQIAHALHASVGAKIIKLADKTSNLRALRSSPPKGWPEARVSEYVVWAGEVVAGCRGANAWLEAQFDEAALALSPG